ncbi:MAG: M48 family metallopeptidase [Candidatus Omnitrophota bacterium]|jgi:predicted Zn-dependent protease
MQNSLLTTSNKLLTQNFCILLFILLLTGCVTIYNPATEKHETYFIDEKTEIAIGKNMTKEILQENKIVENINLSGYVNGIGRKVADKSDRNNLPYYFYVLDDKKINAFAVPGGYIFINKGLLDKLNEDELAFVIGHEIGHIAARHSIKKLQVALGFNILTSIALDNPDYTSTQQAMGVAFNVVSSGYSRQDELLADSLGLKYLTKSGYSPYASINALKKLEGEEESNLGLVFLRTHPLTQERIKQLRKKIESKIP